VAHKGGQPRDNRRYTQGWTIQRKPPTVYSGFSTLVCPYVSSRLSFLLYLLRFSLDCPPLTVRAHKCGQSREHRSGHTQMDNPEKTVGAHKKGQSRENRRGTHPCVPLQFFLDFPPFCAPTVFSGLSTFVCPYGFLWIVHSCVPLRFSLDCPFLCAPTVFSGLSEKTVVAHKGGQPRDNRRYTQGWTIQRKP
jgi:hypothetical protein